MSCVVRVCAAVMAEETKTATEWEKYKTSGNEFYKAHKFESAVSEYTKAVDADDIADADKATVLCNRAQCHLMMKNFEKAVEVRRRTTHHTRAHRTHLCVVTPCLCVRALVCACAGLQRGGGAAAGQCEGPVPEGHCARAAGP